MAKTVTIEGCGIGWKPELAKSEDHHYVEKQDMAPLAAVRRKVDLSEFDSPVRNQGDEGSCVGHGVSACADQLTRMDGDRFNTIYSPRFAYNLARKIEQDRDNDNALKSDGGAYVRDGMDGLRRLGSLPESNWRYVPLKGVTTAPSSTRINRAHSYRIETLRCDDVDSVLNAINDGHPVAGGFTCFTNWWTREVDASGVCPMPTGSARTDGGHCTKWSGYDLDFDFGQGIVGGIFFKNSWSARWGKAFGKLGYGIFPIEFLRRGWADDCWAAVKRAV
jgi:hypothetical protein